MNITNVCPVFNQLTLKKKIIKPRHAINFIIAQNKITILA